MATSTRFRVTLKNLDTKQKVDVVVNGRNVAHAISEADKWANDNWPGATVDFSTWRLPMPKGGYTYHG